MDDEPATRDMQGKMLDVLVQIRERLSTLMESTRDFANTLDEFVTQVPNPMDNETAEMLHRQSLLLQSILQAIQKGGCS